MIPLIVLILLLLMLLLSAFSKISSCPERRSATDMCTFLAEQNCQMSEPMAYMNTCSDDGHCLGPNSATQACIDGVRQKCLAGMGLAVDPDRGMPAHYER